MSNEAITKEAAERLVAALRDATSAIDDAIGVVGEECPPALATEIKRRLAEAMTTLGWDVLETMVYVHHPELRPYALDSSARSE